MRFSVPLVSVIGCFVVAGSMWMSRAVAGDADKCLNGSGDEKLAACTRAIDSGQFQGNNLAVEYINRGIAYKERGDLGRAISDLSEAIRLNPNSADAHRNRGIAYRAEGDLNRAIADHTQAIRLDPKYARAYNARGFAY